MDDDTNRHRSCALHEHVVAPVTARQRLARRADKRLGDAIGQREELGPGPRLAPCQREPVELAPQGEVVDRDVDERSRGWRDAVEHAMTGGEQLQRGRVVASDDDDVARPGGVHGLEHTLVARVPVDDRDSPTADAGCLAAAALALDDHDRARPAQAPRDPGAAAAEPDDHRVWPAPGADAQPLERLAKQGVDHRQDSEHGDDCCEVAGDLERVRRITRVLAPVVEEEQLDGLVQRVLKIHAVEMSVTDEAEYQGDGAYPRQDRRQP